MMGYGCFVLTAVYLPKNDKYIVSGFDTVQNYLDAIQEILKRTHTNADDWKFTVDVDC